MCNCNKKKLSKLHEFVLFTRNQLYLIELGEKIAVFHKNLLIVECKETSHFSFVTLFLVNYYFGCFEWAKNLKYLRHILLEDASNFLMSYIGIITAVNLFSWQYSSSIEKGISLFVFKFTTCFIVKENIKKKPECSYTNCVSEILDPHWVLPGTMAHVFYFHEEAYSR